MPTSTYFGPQEAIGVAVDRLQTIYVRPHERYVVSLIVSYPGNPPDARGESSVIDSPRAAAHWAYRLTHDVDSADTIWCVYDRETKETTLMEQSEFA